MSKHELPTGCPPTRPRKPGIPAEPPFPRPALDNPSSWIPAERAVRLAAAGAALAAELERQIQYADSVAPDRLERVRALLAQWKSAVWAPIPLDAP